MADINITYETLYEFMRNEKNREDLQTLPETFFRDVVSYLGKIKRLAEDSVVMGSPESEQESLQRQVKNIKILIKEIYDRRETKILHLATSTSRTDNETNEVDSLLPPEKEMYNQFLTVLKHYRSHSLKATLEGTIPTTMDRFTSNTKSPDTSVKETTNEQTANKKTENNEEKSVSEQLASPASPTEKTAEQITQPSMSQSSVQSTQQTVTQPKPTSTPEEIAKQAAEAVKNQNFASQPGNMAANTQKQPAQNTPSSQTLQSSTNKDEMAIKFLEKVPKFLGKELEVYGPYEAGDTATIPKELATILTNKGKAKQV